MAKLTDTWPTIRVGHRDDAGQMVWEECLWPPSDSEFRRRLFAVRQMVIAWDLLNGRFVRRPPLHRMPPEPFQSKQHDRLNEVSKTMGPRPSRVRRQLMKTEPAYYWWGTHARMLIPARKGMIALNRRAGCPVPRYIPWRTD